MEIHLLAGIVMTLAVIGCLVILMARTPQRALRDRSADFDPEPDVDAESRI